MGANVLVVPTSTALPTPKSSGRVIYTDQVSTRTHDTEDRTPHRTEYTHIFLVARHVAQLFHLFTKREAGRNTIHFTADSGSIELMMRTNRSANEPSVYGAVSSWCVTCLKGCKVRHLLERICPFQKKMNSYHNSWIHKKLVLW